MQDVSAAPGGKSLILAHEMFAPKAAVEMGAQQTQQEQHQHELQQPAQQDGQQPPEHEGQHQNGGQQPPQKSTPLQTEPPLDPKSQAVLSSSTPGHEAGSNNRGGTAAALGRSEAGAPPPPPPKGSLLVVNEPDATRRARLQHVLAEYLPHALVAGSAGGGSGRRGPVGALKVTGHEADKYWSRHESERYDRVLLDAPCSNDRHIVQQVTDSGGGTHMSLSIQMQHMKCMDTA